MRSDIFVSGLMVLCGVPGWAAIDLLGPTNEWLPLLYEGQSVQSDFILDTQANSPDLDLVGSGEQYAIYTKFDKTDSLLHSVFAWEVTRIQPGSRDNSGLVPMQTWTAIWIFLSEQTPRPSP